MFVPGPSPDDDDDDPWWKELDAEDRGEHASFHASNKIPVDSAAAWIGAIRAWDRHQHGRYVKKAKAFAERYAGTLGKYGAPGVSDAEVVPSGRAEILSVGPDVLQEDGTSSPTLQE